MVNNERHDRAFAEALTNHPYGWALWKKMTINEDPNFTPGCMGWMNSTGDWCFMEKAADASANAKNMGFWGPMYSRKVNQLQVGGSGGTNVPNTPVGASITMEFETYGESQAVLVTEGPVMQYRVPDERVLLSWLHANSSRIVREYDKELKEHSIWIITTIYTTKRRGVCFMAAKDSAVRISLVVEAANVFTLSPTTSWTTARGSSAKEIHADASGVVFYVAGIQVTRPWNKFGSGVKTEDRPEKQSLFRGGEAEALPPLWTKDPDGSDVELHVEYFGQSLDSAGRL